jgi:hypothetical protein
MSEELVSRISALLNRDVEVERTKDGKYVVLYMSFSSPPPPKGDTKEEALRLFLEWYEGISQEPLPEVQDGQ